MKDELGLFVLKKKTLVWQTEVLAEKGSDTHNEIRITPTSFGKGEENLGMVGSYFFRWWFEGVAVLKCWVQQ